jgi:hypothetical protein
MEAAMSYTNPSDPERRASIDPKDPLSSEQLPPRRASEVGGMVWGWVAGIAVLALILAFVFSGGTGSNQSADSNAPGTNAPGMARTTTPPASPGTAQRPPATPPATTGSGSSGQ